MISHLTHTDNWYEHLSCSHNVNILYFDSIFASKSKDVEFHMRLNEYLSRGDQSIESLQTFTHYKFATQK